VGKGKGGAVVVAIEPKGDKATWRTTLGLDLIRPKDLERLLAEADLSEVLATLQAVASPSASCS
jgi:hypothetical protein